MKNKNISYCLYGSDIKYYVGAEKNIEINAKLLPEWNNIIYYSLNNVLPEFVKKLTDLGAIMIDVNTMEISKYLGNPMFWRYLIFYTNQTSIIRDLDSRVSNREVKYIERWLDSDLNYFVIRDHPWHSVVPGGLFGLKNSNLIIPHFEEFIKTKPLGWGSDQEMLLSFIEKIGREDLNYFGFDDEKNYIPRDDENFFIGMQIDEFEKPLSPNAILSLNYLKDLNL
jgi:hypothetical protein